MAAQRTNPTKIMDEYFASNPERNQKALEGLLAQFHAAGYKDARIPLHDQGRKVSDDKIEIPSLGIGWDTIIGAGSGGAEWTSGQAYGMPEVFGPGPLMGAEGGMGTPKSDTAQSPWIAALIAQAQQGGLKDISRDGITAQSTPVPTAQQLSAPTSNLSGKRHAPKAPIITNWGVGGPPDGFATGDGLQAEDIERQALLDAMKGGA
jgi:hypothetical protein